MTEQRTDVRIRWLLPTHDYWSTPFAESLLQHLDLCPGMSILDIASGHGIPAFYLAEQVGPTGQVLAIDLSGRQVESARAIQGEQLPWLRFECLDMRALPPRLPCFDRITGNLSVMFFRPNRFEAVQGLVKHLKPGGQMVLTFPSLGTFDLLWRRIDQEMAVQHAIGDLAAFRGEGQLPFTADIDQLVPFEATDGHGHRGGRYIQPARKRGGDHRSAFGLRFSDGLQVVLF